MKRMFVWISLTMWLLLTFGLYAPATTHALEDNQATRDKLFALASDALISAKSRDYAKTTEALAEVRSIWIGMGDTSSSEEGKAVAEALKQADKALQIQTSAPDHQQAYQAISALAKAIDVYLSASEEGNGDKARTSARSLLPHVEKAMAAVQAEDWTGAKQSFNAFLAGWSKAESLIRKDNASLYGKMEVVISGVRIAIQTEPPSKEKAAAKLKELHTAVSQYASGDAVSAQEADGKGDTGGSEARTISELIGLVNAAAAKVADQDANAASELMDRIIAAWPNVEGAVLTRSQQAYDTIESKMTAVPALLLSNPPKLEQGAQLLSDLREELLPYAEAGSYSAWDAGLILFREGLEAILIISALMAFLDRSGSRDKRKWIWGGAGAGLLASGLLAVLLSAVLSGLSTGSSRELMEGITGLVAVVFMLTIGAWLHSKSSQRGWSRFVEQAIGRSLARGALLSLSFTAFLAVLREGAETIIFYMGMVSGIRMAELLLGVGAALLLLLIIGFSLMKATTRLPVRLFFLAAGLLLYYMAFKFVGVSIHALQISGTWDTHAADILPQIPSIGLYASWEGMAAQLALLAIIIGNSIRLGLSGRLNRKPVQMQ